VAALLDMLNRAVAACLQRATPNSAAAEQHSRRGGGAGRSKAILAFPKTGMFSASTSLRPHPAATICLNRGGSMLHWAAVFFVIALIAALFGFGGIAAGAASIAKVLFVLFIILAIIALVMGRRAPI
jgi:uncharacterized membrane protein YtjA (UPF0391 family)